MRSRQLSPVWEEISSLGFSPLHREVARVLSDFGSNWSSESVVNAVLPRVDAEETDTHYLLTFDLPGVSKENINIDYHDGQLVLTAKRLENKQSKEGKLHINERYEGEFKRILKLPEVIDSSKIEASYQNGVLKVSVPKAEAKKPKRIEVK